MNIDLLKLSAKYAFQWLKKSSPYFCSALQKEVVVSRTFWDHLLHTKKRSTGELFSRLLLIPIIQKILLEGVLIEKREFPHMVKYKIEYKEDDFIFACIVEKTSKKHTLSSCFEVFPYIKK